MRERAGGSPGALGAQLRLPRPGCPPPLGAAASPWGCGAAVSPVGLRLLLGRGGGGGLWSPDAAPRQPRGGGLAVPARGGQLSVWGAHSSPAPLYPVRAGPSCRPSLGPPAPPAVVAWRWLAGGGREGQRSAVSGLRGSGPPLRSLSPPSLPREVARASPSRCIVGGAWAGGMAPPGGASRGTVPPQSPAPVVWAVTCVAACVGVGAAAVAGFAGGSTSG